MHKPLYLPKRYGDESAFGFKNPVNTLQHSHHLAYCLGMGLPWVTTIHKQNIL